MDRRNNNQYRTPSPGVPTQHGYQLDDNPYGAQQPQMQQQQPGLDIPMPPRPGFNTPGASSDRLDLNAAVSVSA